MIYKAELQKKVFFPHPFNCQRRFSNEKVGNRKKLSPLLLLISVLKVVLVSLISNFFTNKTSLVNKWMSFSSSNLALEHWYFIKSVQNPNISSYFCCLMSKEKMKILSFCQLSYKSSDWAVTFHSFWLQATPHVVQNILMIFYLLWFLCEFRLSELYESS